MNVKINKGGNVEFCLEDLINNLSLEYILEFTESASCDGRVIKHVSDQIFNGFTENCYSGANYETKSEPETEIGKARARVIEFADDLAQKEIERLKKMLTTTQNDLKEAEAKYWSAWG